MKVIRNRFLPFRGYTAMNLFGLLLCRRDAHVTPQLVNHERIHTAQMLEMAVVFFYLWYVMEWVAKVFTPGRAYMRISFEREAYAHQDDLDYLSRRKPFAWMKYLRVKSRSTLRMLLLAVVAGWGSVACAQDFLVTRTVTHKASSQGSSYTATVEFPTEGDARVLREVRRWIGMMLDAEGDYGADIRRQLQVAGDTFLLHASKSSRSVEVERAYEDAHCVTFTATVVDKAAERWVTDDCATFSKHDGHRLAIDEIFACSESELQELVWRYRGDRKMDADTPDGIFPLNAGFIDGWVVVTAPADHSPAAAFRLRYEEIVPYLKSSTSGYYR